MAHINRDELSSWLNAQEQIPFSRVAPIDESVEAFDPLHRGFVAEDYVVPARIEELYDRGQRGEQGRGRRMRRTRKWCFSNGLKKPLVPQI